MRKIIFILFISAGFSLSGQKALEVAINTNFRTFTNDSYDPGKDGAALSITILKELNSTRHFRGGLEFGAAGVSNYFAITAAYGFTKHLSGNNMSVNMDVYTRQGTGLYWNGFLYTWGIGDAFSLSYHIPSKGTASVFLGITCYSYPGYKKYSGVYSFLDLNMGLRYTFRAFPEKVD